MDDARYVPIWTVANFNQVKRLTKDIKLITEVLRGVYHIIIFTDTGMLCSLVVIVFESYFSTS